MGKIKFLSFLLILISASISSQETIKEKKDTSVKIIEDVPVFPGCLGDTRALKKCFSKRVQIHFRKKFNLDLPNQLGLAGGYKKVFISFGIDTTGKVVNVNVKAPHIKLEKEVERVVKMLPQMRPGLQDGKAVNVKFSIPFTIYISETKAQKKARKRKERKERWKRRNKN